VCESLTGTIEVRATLSAVGNGGDKSYTVLIDSVSRGTIGPGTPVSYGGFPVGSHNVLLQGIDGDGDVTPSGTRVFVDIVWSAGGTQSYESDGAFNSVTGNGFTGAVQAYNCLEHGSSSYADVTVTIWDASGRASNPQTTRVPRP